MDDTLRAYHRAQDELDMVLAKVGADQWDSPSMCADWTVRDIAGHATWAQRQMCAWATGDEFTDRTGAPGSPHPGVLVGDDPVRAFRTARSACDAALTDDGLTRTTVLPGMGEIPVAAILPLLLTDSIAHAWDIAHPLGIEIQLPPDLLTRATAWARANVVRAPGFFAPELPAPPNADDQTRLMAYLGRDTARRGLSIADHQPPFTRSESGTPASRVRRV
ncbi:TIGR03086 family metal-binding protein [Nocardia wallacei]|uniref:TIGR03086 family metal-binding protein n=1 Tax=Nocardia wallacei TaxID=480035 RepID=UPI0024538C24|nr:TIGR03086 family metal-binding protein [Nocardia wallacei]